MLSIPISQPSSSWWFPCSFLPLYWHAYVNALLFFLGWWIFFDASLTLCTPTGFSTLPTSPAQVSSIKLLPKALPQLISCTKCVVNMSLPFKILSPLWASHLVYGFWGCKELFQPPDLYSRGQNAFILWNSVLHLDACWKSHWAHHLPWAQWRVHGLCFLACVEKYAFENCKSFSAPAFVTTFFLCKYLDMVKVSSKWWCLIIS